MSFPSLTVYLGYVDLAPYTLPAAVLFFLGLASHVMARREVRRLTQVSRRLSRTLSALLPRLDEEDPS